MRVNMADRSTISRVNNSQGHIMEDMIMGAARRYEQQGRLVIHKESEPFRMVKYLNRGRGRAAHSHRGQVHPDGQDKAGSRHCGPGGGAEEIS